MKPPRQYSEDLLLSNSWIKEDRLKKQWHVAKFYKYSNYLEYRTFFIVPLHKFWIS